MSFFNFRNQNKFADIARILSHNEHTSKSTLHERHPHTKDIFDRHNIDLRQIRKKGVKAATAATVLGAFLAFPHLLGNGALNETRPDSNLRTLSIEKQLEQSSARLNQGSHTIAANPTINNSSGASSVESPAIADGREKSQGHIHGRSYLAPPKEHGFHDLGLHKGEDKGSGQAESPGPHPEDLGINHPEKPI